MSINDLLIPQYIERHNHWLVTQGRETFYHPETNELITFDSKQEALEFIKIYQEVKSCATALKILTRY